MSILGEGMKVNINDRQPRFDEGKEREMLRQYLELQTWERMSQAQRNRWWEIEQFRAREPHTITAGDPRGARGARTKGKGMSDMTYTDADVERVAEAMCDADTTSWKNTDDTKTLPDVMWSKMRDDTEYVPYEGISLGRDHYRAMARAALEASDDRN